MPRKQRFKPSRKPKLADESLDRVPVERSSAATQDLHSSAAVSLQQQQPSQPQSGIRHLRGRDAVIDD